MKILIVLALLLASSVCMSADQTGNITVLRATTDSTINSSTSRRIMIFQLDKALDNNCTWLGVTEDNSYFASSLLSAHARKQAVRVWYDTVTPSGSICWAYTIELKS